MASSLHILLFIQLLLVNSSFGVSYSPSAFNPPVFTKQPADISLHPSDAYVNWRSRSDFLNTITFRATDNLADTIAFNFTIPCAATNTNKYTWYRNGGEFDPRAPGSSFSFVNEAVDGTLLVKRWKISDEGTYQCAAANDGNQIFSSTFPIRSVVLSDKYNSFVPPAMPSAPTSHPMNQDLTINCFERTQEQCGTPETCAKPYKLTVEFAPMAASTSNLIFTDISDSIAAPYTFLDKERGLLYFVSYPEPSPSGRTNLDGTYRCKLTPDGGGNSIFTNLKYINFISNPAQQDPSLIYPPASKGKYITLYENSAVTLQCIFKGFPRPQVSYNADSELNAVDHSGKLFLQQPTRSMHNKKLTCTGSPPRGMAGASKDETFTILVEYPPNATMTMRLLPFIRDSDTAAHIICDVSLPVNPAPVVTFNFKGQPISDPRKSVKQDDPRKVDRTDVNRYRLSISNPTPADAGVYVCNATNSQGSSFSATRLVFLEPTRVHLYFWDDTQTELNKSLITPNAKIQKTNGSAHLKCEIASKDSQNYLINANGGHKDDQKPEWIYWTSEGEYLISGDDNREITTDGSLVIKLGKINNSTDPAISSLVGAYACRFRDAASGAAKPIDFPFTFFYKDPAPSALVKSDKYGQMLPSQTDTAGFPLWLIAVLLAVLLAIVLVSLIIFLVRRKKAGTYLVDAKERAQGNDPEKELKEMGFHDYVRPDQDPRKGTRASMDSLVPVGSDDEDALDEYAEMDTGKFNEDGSFIGQYNNSRQKNAPRKPSRNPEDGVPTSTLRSAAYASGPPPPVGPEGIPLVHPYETMTGPAAAGPGSRGPSTLRSTLVGPTGIQMEGSAL